MDFLNCHLCYIDVVYLYLYCVNRSKCEVIQTCSNAIEALQANLNCGHTGQTAFREEQYCLDGLVLMHDDSC